ncbi:hypothetical protein TYRP_023490 [Tyrophagus putrescentiae]|nr:hypothetical protein TYRP_023490 [Tyrophagus putrescentiae]
MSEIQAVFSCSVGATSELKLLIGVFDQRCLLQWNLAKALWWCVEFNRKTDDDDDHEKKRNSSKFALAPSYLNQRQLAAAGARAEEHVIGEEVTLADGLALVPAEAAAQSGAGRLEATGGAAAAAAPSFAARRAAAEHLEDAALADEHLVHVEENVAAADDDALDGECSEVLTRDSSSSFILAFSRLFRST